jgi:hypothetical protein
MLNWAARYYPILRAFEQHNLLSSGSVLEIGCGPVGLGTFRKVPFVGCDLSFPDPPPAWPMTPVVASAADLPFEDRSFDAVLGSDVLEHIPPDLRTTVISEALRVARQLVIFGFPCGSAAHDADRALRQLYLSKQLEVPIWLEEHMLASFPEEPLFREFPGWTVTHVGNESIAFHSWMMRREMGRVFRRGSSLLLKLAPRMLEYWLRKADTPPFYRQIFILTRDK